MFCYHVYDSQEYSDFIKGLTENKEILAKKWDQYLNKITEELLKADPSYRNPQILIDFIKMSFANSKIAKGRPSCILHLL